MYTINLLLLQPRLYCLAHQSRFAELIEMISLFALALAPLVSSSSGPQWQPWKSSENATSEMGGCGWSKCYNCVGGHCSPTNQKCTGKPPKYTFHLADPTCDINDPNGPFYDPVHG